MHIGFVEHHVFTITPGVALTVDEDAASVGIGRRQSQVVTQRAGEWIAVRIEMTATRQQGKHRPLDIGNGAEQRHGLRAQQFGRGQGFVVPLEVEALPAFLEKGTESGIVVFFRSADVTLVKQVHRFVADNLPIVLEHVQFGKPGAVQIGF
ncbi:hypothetical protein D3C76_1336870 [compost metagenome]